MANGSQNPLSADLRRETEDRQSNGVIGEIKQSVDEIREMLKELNEASQETPRVMFGRNP